MRYGKRKKKIFIMSSIAILLFCGMSMMGCSSKDSIVGTWHAVGSDYVISFYEDGTCTTSKGDEIINYTQQEDGTLMFTWGLFGNEMIIKRTDDKEQALGDDEYYYLSDNTFIFSGETCEKQ